MPMPRLNSTDGFGRILKSRMSFFAHILLKNFAEQQRVLAA